MRGLLDEVEDLQCQLGFLQRRRMRRSSLGWSIARWQGGTPWGWEQTFLSKVARCVRLRVDQGCVEVTSLAKDPWSDREVLKKMESREKRRESKNEIGWQNLLFT